MGNIESRNLGVRYRGRSISICYFDRPGSPENPESKDTILCLHGMGCSKEDFGSVMEHPHLAEFRIVALDFPGCGRTEYPGVLGIEGLAKIVGLFASELKIERTTMVGHSLGGAVGLLLAGGSSDWLHAFINVEGNLAPEDCFFSRRVSGLGEDDQSLGDWIERMTMEFAQSPFPGMRAFADHLQHGLCRAALRDYSSSLVRHSDQCGLLSRFIDLRIPKLFLHGSANRHLSYIPRLRDERIPVIETPNSHHWPHLDNPSFFYRAIGDFIASNSRLGMPT